MRFLIRARNRTVAVADGRIVPAEGPFAHVLDLPDADLRPGLINAHDHLHRNHYGPLGRPPYANAGEWARDIQARFADAIAAGRKRARREALLDGAWKNLFAGVTSVVHHDAWEPDFDRDFPIRVLPVASADSLTMTPEAALALCGERVALHVAEGVDAAAGREVATLAAAGLLGASLIAVHCVGVSAEDAARLRRAGAAFVWCPTSNLFLLGRTAPREMFEGLDVLLGSDSLLTGAGDLLDELRTARALGRLDDARLEAAVSSVAARRLGAPEPSLEVGAPADLAAFAAPLLEAHARDVRLVVVDGLPRVAATELAPALDALSPGGAIMRRGDVLRWTAAARSHPIQTGDECR